LYTFIKNLTSLVVYSIGQMNMEKCREMLGSGVYQYKN